MDLLQISAAALRAGGHDPGSFSIVQLNRSAVEPPSVAWLVFPEGQSSPVLFAKAARDGAGVASLEVEFENLAWIAEHAEEPLRSSVPRPLLQLEHGDWSILVETVLPGIRVKNFPPTRYFATGRAVPDVRHATSCLAQLAEAARRSAPTSEPAESVADAIADFRQRFMVSAATDRLLDESAERLGARELPRPPSHGDFCTANLLAMADGRLGIIDWQYPLTPGWPLADLLYFLSSIWCTRYSRKSQAIATNFERMFFDPHPRSALVVGAIEALAGELGLDASLRFHASALAWVGFARRKHAELAAAPGLAARSHLPLVLLDGGRCLNLEILAARRTSYLCP